MNSTKCSRGKESTRKREVQHIVMHSLCQMERHISYLLAYCIDIVTCGRCSALSFATETLQVASKLGQMQIMDDQLEEGLTTLRRCVMQAEEHYSPESRGYATALPQHLEVLAEGLQRSGDLMGARDLLHKAMGLRRVRSLSIQMSPIKEYTPVLFVTNLSLS